MKLNRKTLYNIEFLRVISAVFIVYFHVVSPFDEVRKYAYSGLVIFLLISTTLIFYLPKNNQNFQEFWTIKSLRIALPFVVWSSFYFIVSIVLRGGGIAISKISLATIISGTFYHLWYLPFIYCVVLLSYPLKKALSTLSMKGLGRICLILGMLMMLFQTWLINRYEIDVLILQWLSSFPAVFFGIAFAEQLRINSNDVSSISPLYPICIILNSVLCYSFSSLLPNQMYSIAYALGTFMFCGSFFLQPILRQPSISDLVKGLSSLTLGIYLIHPFVLLVVVKFSSFQLVSIKFIVTLVISSVTVAALRKFSLFRLIM